MGDPYRHEMRRLSSSAQLFHMQRELPWTAAVFVITAGHMHDPVGKEGTAHLLEHYVSGGRIGNLPAMSKPKLRDWLEDQGLSANLGETGPYYSLYAGKALNDSAATLLGFLSDLVFRPGFDNDLEHDREIVRAERIERVSRRNEEIEAVELPILYGTHRRATMDPLPQDHVLNAITREDVLAYHHRYYGAWNLRVITLGGVSIDQVAFKLERCLPVVVHGLSKGVGPIPELPLAPFAERERTFAPVNGRKPVKADLRWTWHLPTGFFGKRLVTEACLGPILMERIRERLRATYHVSAGTHSNADHAVFEIEARVAIERVADVCAEVEVALQDVEAIQARIPRTRMALKRQTLLTDMTYRDTIRAAAMSVAATGRIVITEEHLSEIESVSSVAVARFVRESLAIEKAYLAIVES